MMVAVFLHGVPETCYIWDAVRQRMPGRSVALALPGFGAELPQGFTATKDEYADWLAEQVTAFDEPVDLVGHDWGALLTIRLATAYDVPLRSWVADVAACFDSRYRWHPRAVEWQTPDVGERAVAGWLAADAADPASIAGVLRAHGSPNERAAAMAAQLNDTTMRSILSLYRSAAPTLHHDWGAAISGPTSAPGLVVIPTADSFIDPGMSRDVADLLGTRIAVLPGLHHAWMNEAPSTIVDTLTAFWQNVTPVRPDR
jgi:pimeloyl-ACP methyl ester carboxylesterase